MAEYGGLVLFEKQTTPVGCCLYDEQVGRLPHSCRSNLIKALKAGKFLCQDFY